MKNFFRTIKMYLAHPVLFKLRPGVTVYKVYALGHRSHMSEYKLSGYPFWSEHTNSLFIKYKYKWGNEEHESEFSLCDANIIPNCYNAHKTFFNKGTAEHYERICKGRSY